MLIGSVSQVALNHIGVLIVDEIRNVAENKNGRNIDTNFIMPDAGGGGYVLRVFANIGCAVIFPYLPTNTGRVAAFLTVREYRACGGISYLNLRLCSAFSARLLYTPP